MAPKGMQTRPTSDRLRETLFNVIAPRIAGSRFVDLYAGSGAVGIEAISRGAAQVFFAEKAAPAIAAIHANLSALKIAAGFTLNVRGALPLLSALARGTEPVDVVFLDPPYEAAEEYQAVLEFLGEQAELGKVISDQTLVIAEHSKKLPLAAAYGALHCTRVLLQGDAALSFFSVQERSVQEKPVQEKPVQEPVELTE